MNIDITALKNGTVKYISFDEEANIDKEMFDKNDLLDLKDVRVAGTISLDTLHEYQISISISGIMVLPCAITLKPVDFPFNVEVNGNINELLEEIDENHKKSENSIDILPIIWENILMEIPLRVVSEDAQNITMAGEGWKLITEYESKSETNPELEKLKDLL